MGDVLNKYLLLTQLILQTKLKKITDESAKTSPCFWKLNSTNYSSIAKKYTQKQSFKVFKGNYMVKEGVTGYD